MRPVPLTACVAARRRSALAAVGLVGTQVAQLPGPSACGQRPAASVPAASQSMCAAGGLILLDLVPATDVESLDESVDDAVPREE